MSFNITSTVSEGFAVGDQIGFTYTATNDTGSALVFPEGAIIAAEYIGRYEDPLPTPSDTCQINGFGDPGPYVVLEYAFNLPTSLAPGDSLSCTLTYAATETDVANGGVWTRFYYQPGGYLGDWAAPWWAEAIASTGANEWLTMTGNPTVGSTLTTTLGYWGQWDTFSYKWLRGGVAIASATAPTYVLTAADVGAAISVEVTGLNDEDTSTIVQTSTPTAPITAPLIGATPTIAGSAAVGSILTATPGVWTAGATLAYEWSAGGAKIAGASAKKFTVTSAELGKPISVKVTGTLGGASVAKSSAATAAVAKGTLVAPTPTIAGSVAVGSTLTAVPGSWTSGATLSYQWYASGVAVSGATAKTFVLTSAQLGRPMTVKVTGSKSGYTSGAKTSASSVKVAVGKLAAPVPTIAGTAKVGGILTAKPGAWTSGTAFTYQWYAAGVAISGATKPTFTLTSTQLSRAVTVKVTGAKAGYTTVAKTSAGTVKVAAGTLTAPVPTVAGVAKVGRILTAKPGVWTTGATLKYQWYAAGVAISGATKSTLTLTSAQVGRAVTVKVTGAKAGYTTVAKFGAGTAKVVK